MNFYIRIETSIRYNQIPPEVLRDNFISKDLFDYENAEDQSNDGSKELDRMKEKRKCSVDCKPPCAVFIWECSLPPESSSLYCNFHTATVRSLRPLGAKSSGVLTSKDAVKIKFTSDRLNKSHRNGIRWLREQTTTGSCWLIGTRSVTSGRGFCFVLMNIAIRDLRTGESLLQEHDY